MRGDEPGDLLHAALLTWQRYQASQTCTVHATVMAEFEDALGAGAVACLAGCRALATH